MLEFATMLIALFFFLVSFLFFIDGMLMVIEHFAQGRKLAGFAGIGGLIIVGGFCATMFGIIVAVAQSV